MFSLSTRQSSSAVATLAGFCAGDSCSTRPKVSICLRASALSLAEAGRCEEALRIQNELVALAEKLENEELASRLRADLVRYEAGSPCRPASEDAAAKNSAKVPESVPEPERNELKPDEAEREAAAENKPQPPPTSEPEASLKDN